MVWWDSAPPLKMIRLFLRIGGVKRLSIRTAGGSCPLFDKTFENSFSRSIWLGIGPNSSTEYVRQDYIRTTPHQKLVVSIELNALTHSRGIHPGCEDPQRSTPFLAFEN